MITKAAPPPLDPTRTMTRPQLEKVVRLAIKYKLERDFGDYPAMDTAEANLSRQLSYTIRYMSPEAIGSLRQEGVPVDTDEPKRRLTGRHHNI